MMKYEIEYWNENQIQSQFLTIWSLIEVKFFLPEPVPQIKQKALI